LSYAYYPGCSLETTAKGYDLSTKAVFESLNLELVPIPDWNCCGATAASGADPAMSAALAVRNFQRTDGADTIVVPCSGCYKYLRKARKSLMAKPEFALEVGQLLDSDSLGPFPTIEHPLRTLLREQESIASSVKVPLEGLRVACYYGCMISRPLGGFDDPENPTSMDTLLRAVGAATVPYEYKTRCCGGPVMMPQADLAFDMTAVLLQKAVDQGANCLALGCPLCAMLVDLYQPHIERRAGRKFQIPVFYFTQLMGLAFGVEHERLGLRYNAMEPFTLLEEAGLMERIA